MADSEQLQKEEGFIAEQAEGSLLEQIMQENRMKPSDEGYNVAKRGVEAFITQLLEPKGETQRVEKALVDQMIAELDKKLSVQVDEIMHHKSFQQL
ncbi:MAG: type VI secretion system contractile sheath large subunit, partial [Candidatus Thiodiazotropha sp.]